MAVENRRHPRAEISWPVTVVTDDGIISARTENLSLVGTLICCTEIPVLLYEFRLIFRPTERQLLITTAERVWPSTFVNNDSIAHEMGVRFTYIPEHERHEFSRIISGQIKSQCEDATFEKIQFHKCKCSLCKANLFMRATVKKCPVCGGSLPAPKK
jgi:hypothetical protein